MGLGLARAEGSKVKISVLPQKLQRRSAMNSHNTRGTKRSSGIHRSTALFVTPQCAELNAVAVQAGEGTA